MIYLITLILVLCSALFSGLTLGLLSLDVHTLKRQAKLGNTDAALVHHIRQRGNLLLTTLLLGNVVVNTTLSIFLGSIAGGLVAGIIATTLIFLGGEIIPQAVISRYALWFGARTIWFTRAAILLFYPIAYPIAYLLDKLLGHEMPTMYSKSELMEIISEHEDSEHSQIDEDEERILHGALRFSHMRVREVMTPSDAVTSFDEQQRLNDDFFNTVNEYGYSRFPVYSGHKENIIGILYAKDLIVEDEHIAIKNTTDALDTDMLIVRPNEFLDSVLTKMLKQRRHLAIVKNKNQQFLGVLSLEDIIEEIIQVEIEDEDDVDE